MKLEERIVIKNIHFGIKEVIYSVYSYYIGEIIHPLELAKDYKDKNDWKVISIEESDYEQVLYG